jgi:hypothetical protein
MKINRRMCAPYALILFAALMVSCAQRSELASLVPENAAFFVQVTSVEKLFTNIDEFVKEIGSQALLNNQSVKETIDQALKSENETLSLSMFDLSKPVGLALVLPGVNEEDPTPIVYLPVKNMKEDFDKIVEAFGGDTSKVVKAGSYAVIYDDPNEMKFPPEKSLDISSLSKYKNGSVSFLVNATGIVAQYGAMLDAGLKEGLKELESAEGAEAQATDALFQKIGAALIDAVKQTESLDGSLYLSKSGLETYGTMSFLKDKGLAEFAAALAASKGTASFVKYLPLDSLIAVSANMSPKAQKLASDYSTELLGAMPGMTPADLAFSRRNTEQALKLSGEKSAASFDFGMDIARIEALGAEAGEDPTAIANGVFDAISMKVVMAGSSTDAPAYLNFMATMFQDPSYKAIMSQTASSTGIGIEFVAEDKTEGDLAYKLMKMKMSVTDAEKLGIGSSAEEKTIMAAVFDSASNKFPFYMSSRKGVYFMAVGDEGLPMLGELVKNDKHPENLSKDAAFAAFSRLAGDDGQVLARLSTNKLLGLLTTFAGAATGESQSYAMPAESNQGLWMMARARGNSIQTVGFWGAKDISAVVQQGTSLFMTFGSMFSSAFGGGDEYTDWEGTTDTDEWTEEDWQNYLNEEGQLGD